MERPLHAPPHQFVVTIETVTYLNGYKPLTSVQSDLRISQRSGVYKYLRTTVSSAPPTGSDERRSESAGV